MLYYGNCACDPIFGLDFRPQIGCALTHRLISQSLLNSLHKSFNRQFLTWNRFWPNPQFRYALPPKELITKLEFRQSVKRSAEAEASQAL